jgi:hypothetical protein
MQYLLFVDELREHAGWIAVAFLFFLAALMIRAPRMQSGFRRAAVRMLGSALFGLLVVLCLLGAAVSGDPPRQHIGFTSKAGARVALLSHSELRDAAATQVTVNGDCCFRRYVAYEYFGDGDDYVGATSIKWVDDHHLSVTYALDPSGLQKCHPQAGDVQVICNPQPEPEFHGTSNRR